MPRRDPEEATARAERKRWRPVFIAGIPLLAITLYATAACFFWQGQDAAGGAFGAGASGMLVYLRTVLGWLTRPDRRLRSCLRRRNRKRGREPVQKTKID
jgi:hypothetical protein